MLLFPMFKINDAILVNILLLFALIVYIWIYRRITRCWRRRREEGNEENRTEEK